MILRLGPITIMSTSTRDAYANLARAAYDLHSRIWYADDLCVPAVQLDVRRLNDELSTAISHAPPEDIR